MSTELSIEDIAEVLASLTIKDAKELLGILEDKYGIKPASAAVVQAPSSVEAKKPEEEKSTFSVYLDNPGNGRIAVVKLIRELTGLGLQESKAKIDELPSLIAENVPKEKANDIKAKLEEAGAKVSLK